VLAVTLSAMIAVTAATSDGPAEWLTAIGTLALALVTVATLIVTVRMARADRTHDAELRRQDREREDNLRREADEKWEQRRRDEQRQRADQDALQVIVEFMPRGPSQVGEAIATGDRVTHQITVTAFAAYQIKDIDARMALQANSGLSTFGTGWSFGAPEFAEGLARYRCRVSLNSQQRDATPIVRFTDANGWQYYWYRGHTRRQPQSATFEQAADAIDKWIRRGPEPDEPSS
jgi:hypothetical protein